MHSNSIEKFEWWFKTLTLPTGPEVFSGLGGWAYCWTNVVGLGAGRYCSLHLLECQDGWLASFISFAHGMIMASKLLVLGDTQRVFRRGEIATSYQPNECN